MSSLFPFVGRVLERFLVHRGAVPGLGPHKSAVRAYGVALPGIVLGLALEAASLCGQPVALEFLVDGPGAVVVRCPPPYIAGQGLILQAQPLPNTAFVRWEDGSTAAERFLVVSTNQTQFIAFFQDVHATTYLSFLDWAGFDPAGRAHAQYPSASGRTKLSFTLGARQTYQVFQATDLQAGYFMQVPLAVSAGGPVNVSQRLAEAGLVEIWVTPPTNVAHVYYEIRLDGASPYPCLFFSQASNAPPGATMNLYGEGLNGSVTAWAGTNAIAASAVNDVVARVTLPSAPGLYLVTVAVNGFLALGALPITVTTNTGSMPVVTSMASLPAESGGVLEVVGRNLTPQSEFFLDGRKVTIISVSASGSNAVVRLPGNFGGSHQLTVVNQGSIGSPLTVSFSQDTYSYVPTTRKGVRVYSWDAYQPNAYTYVPATGKGVRVYAWDSSQPNAYSLTPGTQKGVRVYAWDAYQPNAYSLAPGTTTGVRVYAWDPYQPGAYSYAPATIRGVRVQGKP